MKRDNPWRLNKKLTPQFVDHAGVLWHGSYLNWLEESRISALSEAGIEYCDLLKLGFEMPVREISINYILPIPLGELITIESYFHINKSPRINIESYFLNPHKKCFTKSKVQIVLVRSNDFRPTRKKPDKLNEVFENLLNGPDS